MRNKFARNGVECTCEAGTVPPWSVGYQCTSTRWLRLRISPTNWLIHMSVFKMMPIGVGTSISFKPWPRKTGLS